MEGVRLLHHDMKHGCCAGKNDSMPRQKSFCLWQIRCSRLWEMAVCVIGGREQIEACGKMDVTACL